MRRCSRCDFVSLSVLEKTILGRLKRGECAETDLAFFCGVSLPAVFNAVKRLECAKLVRTKKVVAKHGLKKIVFLQS